MVSGTLELQSAMRIKGKDKFCQGGGGGVYDRAFQRDGTYLSFISVDWWLQKKKKVGKKFIARRNVFMANQRKVIIKLVNKNISYTNSFERKTKKFGRVTQLRVFSGRLKHLCYALTAIRSR